LLPVGLSSEKSSHAMLNSTKMAALFAQLQKEADIVLVAASPISRFAETLTLASQVNAVVLVARRAEARSKVVSKVIQNLRLMKINLAGVIFDYNASPFVSNAGRKTSSAASRDSSTGTLTQSNLSEQTTES
jgi:Mrp family chromosome partitioning ATPase